MRSGALICGERGLARMRAVRLLLLVATQILFGCTTVSVARYQTAKPLAKDESQFIAGASIPKSGAHGLDRGVSGPDPEATPRPPQEGSSVRMHHGWLNAADFTWNYGVTNRLQSTIQVQFWGAKFGMRYTWLNTSLLKAASGGYVGGTWGIYDRVDEGGGSQGGDVHTRGLSTARYLDFPTTISIHPGERFALIFGGTVTRVGARARLTDEDVDATETTPDYYRRASYWQAGGFIGASFGRRIQVTPGLAFYREPRRHPMRSWTGSGVWVYPYVGVVFNAPHKKRRTPPTQPTFDPLQPAPPPEPETTPSPIPTPTPSNN